MRIVAISGKMHSGKTFISDTLVGVCNYRRLSYAQPLKDDVREMGFSWEDIREKPPWMRFLLQAYGQARRAQDPDYWVKRMEMRLRSSYTQKQLSMYAQTPLCLVIDDLRFENEADSLRLFAEEHEGCGLVIARVERIGYDRSNLKGARDASECALDDYDFDVVFNVKSGDLDGLKSVAATLAGWDFGRASGTGIEGVAD